MDFRGQQRRNDTHASTMDPDACLHRKSNGQESTLSYLGHVVTENRNGLVVGAGLRGRHAAQPTVTRPSARWLLRQPAKSVRATATDGELPGH